MSGAEIPHTSASREGEEKEEEEEVTRCKEDKWREKARGCEAGGQEEQAQAAAPEH